MSWLLASATADPRLLVEQTLPVIAELLDGLVVVLVSDHPALGGEPVEVVATHPSNVARCDDRLGRLVTDHARPRGETAGQHRLPGGAGSVLVTPLPLDGRPRGFVAALVPEGVDVDGTDLAILGTITNQLAGAIESRRRLAESELLREAATSALDAVAAQAAALERRNAMLKQTRHELVAARERQVLAEERQRIARDLHDSVAQHVLSMGMQVEWCRTTSTEPEVVAQLTEVKGLARTTVGRIRQAIFELGGSDELGPGLVVALRRMAQQHQVHGLDTAVRVVGKPQQLPVSTERALFMAAKEALFNTVIHAEATRASVHLSFVPGSVRLLVTDNGLGRAAHLRDCLEQARLGCTTGYHRGLGNMDERIRLAGGRMTITDAPRRGVRVEALVPTAPHSPTTAEAAP